MPVLCQSLLAAEASARGASLAARGASRSTSAAASGESTPAKGDRKAARHGAASPQRAGLSRPAAKDEAAVSLESQVYLIPSTGEYFYTYEYVCARASLPGADTHARAPSEYLERLALYHRHVWACRLTGRIGLTYAEAVESELRAQEAIQDFPEWWKAHLLAAVHCCTARLFIPRLPRALTQEPNLRAQLF